MGTTRADLNAMVKLYDAASSITEQYVVYHDRALLGRHRCSIPEPPYTQDDIYYFIAQDAIDLQLQYGLQQGDGRYDNVRDVWSQSQKAVWHHIQTLPGDQQTVASVMTIFDHTMNEDRSYSFMGKVAQQYTISGLAVLLFFLMNGEGSALINRLESSMQHLQKQWGDPLTVTGQRYVVTMHILNAVHKSLHAGAEYGDTPWPWVRALFMQEVLQHLDDTEAFDMMYQRHMVQEALNYTTFKDM